MRNAVSTLLLLTAVPTGCGIDSEVVEENLEHRLRWQQEAASEIQDCHTFKLGNARNVEVDRLQVKFAQGSHHVHIYRSSEPAPDGVWDCFSGIDWKKWSLVVGAQTQAMDWQLPEGVTIPFEPHQQLLAQVHWLNTTDEAEEPTIDLSFHTTEDSQEHLGVLFGVNQRVFVPANSVDTRITHYCQLPEGAKLHAMMGHFHARGKDYRVIERMPSSNNGTEIYFSKDEPGFEFKMYSPARDIPRGAGLEYECGFDNRSGAPLTWGSDTATQEHCNMTAYFSPADKVSEMCILEPSKLTALTSAEDSVRAGKDFVFAVELASAEPEDVVIELSSSNSAALEVPRTITIPKGETVASFYGRTHKPAHVEVSASLNGAKITKPVRVTGLAISEVFYNPATGATNQLQWIEIVNQTDVQIDLSGYSIGAGTTDLTTTRLSLPMTIAPRGCIVVGGPESGPANHSPVFALNEDLSPDLSLGGDMAAGVALYGTTASEMTPTLAPLDVVVYSGQSTSIKGPDGQIVPIWPGSAPGGSLRRKSDTAWAASSYPNPGTCEVLNVH